jgi:PKD repeat protein
VSPPGVALVAATSVAFSADATDPDGDTLTYDWNFGDGTSATNAGPSTQHVFGSAGTLAVALTVRDPRGASAILHTPVVGVTLTGTWRGCALSGTGVQTYEIDQSGAGVAGTYKVPTYQTAFQGTLGHPRQMAITIFDGQLQVFSLDAAGTTLTRGGTCVLSRE